MDLTEVLRSREQSLLQPFVRAHPEELSLLLTDDFLEIGSSGRVFTKRQLLEELQGETAIDVFEMTDFAAEMLSSQIALVTYRIFRRDAAGVAREQSMRSSIWINRADAWRVRFHQGTKLP